jgi:hypothetical protein
VLNLGDLGGGFGANHGDMNFDPLCVGANHCAIICSTLYRQQQQQQQQQVSTIQGGNELIEQGKWNYAI